MAAQRDIIQLNERALKRLLRTIRLSEGQFSLILVHCNYTGLRRKLVEQITEQASGNVRVIRLPESVETLFSFIRSEIEGQPPDAVMVLGMESVRGLKNILLAANQVREEFRKHFPFAVVLWMNDEVLNKFSKLAPDFKSWSGSPIDFQATDDDLLTALEQSAEYRFAEFLNGHQQEADFLFNLADETDFEHFLKDIEERDLSLSDELKADLYFLQGEYARSLDQTDAAVSPYETSLAFWQETERTDRQGVLLCYLGRCYGQQKDFEKAKTCFQECLNAFEGREKLTAKCSLELCDVLLKSGDWDELERVARQTLEMNDSCGLDAGCAESCRILAEVALHRERWEAAVRHTKDGLRRLDLIDDAEIRLRCASVRNRLWFILAKAWKGPDEPEKAIDALENLRKEGLPDADPKLYIDALEFLRTLYFDGKNYLKAFEIKQERISIEHQFGFRAFIGAGRLKPRRRSRRTEEDLAIEIQASGRQHDVNRLLEKVQRKDCRLIVLHGPSGVGKSSILEAGLMPALRQTTIDTFDVMPLLIRSYTDWKKQIAEFFPALCAGTQSGMGRGSVPDGGYTAERCNHKNDDPNIFFEELQKNETRYRLIVLILDQFEEFFFANSETEKRREFYEFLKEYLNIPYTKAILSLREDYLHYLLEIDRMADLEVMSNDILNKAFRYELGNLTPDDAKAVIKNLTKQSDFRPKIGLIDRHPKIGLIDRVVADLAEDRKEIRPIELQILGAQLQAEEIVTEEAYEEKGKAALIKGFLEEVIRDCGWENEDAALLTLYLLTDENKTRPLKTRSELMGDLKEYELEVSGKQLDLTLKILKGAGLVFLIPEEPADRYQIVHDYLVELAQMRAKQVLDRLEQQRISKLAEEKRKKQAAYEKQRRQKKILIMSVVASIVFAVLTGTAVWFGIQAKKSQKLAKNAELKLKKNVAETLNGWARDLYFKNRGYEAIITGIKSGKILKEEKNFLDRIGYKIIPNLQQYIYEIKNVNQFRYNRPQCVCFSPNGKILAYAGDDKKIKLWYFDNNNQKILMGHSSSVRCLTFNSDGSVLASGSDSGRIMLWEVSTGEKIYEEKAHSKSVLDIKFSPDGKKIGTGSADNTITLRDDSGKLITILKGGHKNIIRSISFSPNGTILASGGDDRKIILWDLTSNKPLKERKNVHVSEVMCVCFSPDGNKLATCGGDNKIKIWETNDLSFKNSFSETNVIRTIAFKHDGKLIVSGNNLGIINFWNIKTKAKVKTITGHSDNVMCVAFNSKGNMLASSGLDDIVKIWELPDEVTRLCRPFSVKSEFSKNTMMNISFSSDGKLIASGNKKGKIIIWNVSDGTVADTFKEGNYTLVALSPDKKLLAAGGRSNKVILWRIDKNKMPASTIIEHKSDIYALSFSPNSKLIASASARKDKTIKIYNTDTRHTITLKGHLKAVRCLGFSSDGKMLVSGSEDGTIRLWNIKEGTEIRNFKDNSGTVRSVSFSPDGKILASCSDNNTIKLWKISDGKKFRSIGMHSGTAVSLNFSPDGKMLASGNNDNTVTLWNVSDGTEIRSIKGHLSISGNLFFRPDGKKFITLDKNMEVRQYNFDLDDLLLRGCKKIRDYLKNPEADISAEDRCMCDDILPPEERVCTN